MPLTKMELGQLASMLVAPLSWQISEVVVQPKYCHDYCSIIFDKK